MDDLVNGYYRLCVWVTRFAYLNVLWVLFTCIGLVVFGAMPSTVAMFAVIRKWVSGQGDTPIFKTFLDSYRNEFVKANIFGYILLAIGFILYIDLQFLRAQDGIVYMIFSYGILLLFFIYFIILIFAIPVFVHFELKFTQYITWPIVIGILHPIITVAIILGVIAAFYMLFKVFPILAIFFGGSVMAFILMFGSAQTFSKFEAR